MMLGSQGVVRLSIDEDVTLGLGICEGIEDGLAVLQLGWALCGLRPVHQPSGSFPFFPASSL